MACLAQTKQQKTKVNTGISHHAGHVCRLAQSWPEVGVAGQEQEPEDDAAPYAAGQTSIYVLHKCF